MTYPLAVLSGALMGFIVLYFFMWLLAVHWARSDHWTLDAKLRDVQSRLERRIDEAGSHWRSRRQEDSDRARERHEALASQVRDLRSEVAALRSELARIGSHMGPPR